MFVVDGGVADPAADRRVSRRLVERVRRRGSSGLRVWRPPRQLAFGPRDTHEPGYPQATAAARRHGFPPFERSVGGRPVALTGTTVTVLWVTQIDDVRRGLEGRYATARDRLERTLESLGVTPTRDEPPNSFCPGQHGLSAEGKLVGLAQRVRADVAVVAGLIVIDDHDAIATVLADVYDALDVPFDPASVGSLERAGGEADPDAVIATVERAFLEETAATRVEAATLRSDDETATSSRTL